MGEVYDWATDFNDAYSCDSVTSRYLVTLGPFDDLVFYPTATTIDVVLVRRSGPPKPKLVT